MNIKTIATIAAILVILGAGIAMARPNAVEGNFWNSMMDGLNNGINGMMGSGNGNGGMMDSGMMGPGNSFEGYSSSGTAGVSNDANPITIDQAKALVEIYLAGTGNTDLAIAEIIEFDNHFYTGIKEISTGKYAIELLVNRYTGSVFPEMGPNMMWNTKYGNMNWNTQGTATVTEEQAIENAQEYLRTELPGTEVEGADAFYGYYTLEVIKDGTVYGMLSVNANTGAVWYHNWHGTFVKILEVE